MNQKEFNLTFTGFVRTPNSDGLCTLLTQIKEGSKISAARALEVYQEDYRARLTEALKNTFIAVYHIIGDETFSQLAGEYIDFYPSPFSDLDDYGNHFAQFLSTHSLAEDYVFLSELANFEWNFREVFHLKQDDGISGADLAEMFSNTELKVQLINSARVLSFNYLITSLYALKDNDDNEESFDFKIPQFLLMCKKSQMVISHSLTINQWIIVERLLTPCSLAELFLSPPVKITPEEIQELFQILGTGHLLLKITN